MKKIIMLLILLFISVDFIYSVEVTLGLGWRISDSGLVLGEYSFPFSWSRIVEYHDPVYGVFRETETRDFTLARTTDSFQRRACFVLGLDFFLYNKQVSLGFELSAGYFEREHKEFFKVVTEIDGVIVVEGTDEYTSKTTIVPINFFVVTKYKFDSIKKSVGWLRPYVGIGGGLSATIFSDGILELDENYLESGEETFVNSKSFLATIGTDLFFSKKAGFFIEFKYVKPLDKGKNFRDEMTLGIGFRFI